MILGDGITEISHIRAGTEVVEGRIAILGRSLEGTSSARHFSAP
jgi:hypothetical protein